VHSRPHEGEAARQPRYARIERLALLLWAVIVDGGGARRYRPRACDAKVVMR